MKAIIIGGGFAGLELAGGLNNIDGIDILLIDKLPYHQFQPLFYQVATASIDGSTISFPLRKVFHKSRNIKIRIADVTSVDQDSKQVFTDIGVFSYDILIIAMGAKTNFFGNKQLEALTFPMKSTMEAWEIMNHVINNFENSLDESSISKRQELMSLAIVGAGPTGVELAGSFAEMRRHILPKDYPELDFSEMKIYLIDMQASALQSMGEKSGKNAAHYLQKLGVELLFNVGVEAYDGRILTLNNGQIINTQTVIWAAGVIAHEIDGFDRNKKGSGKRLIVDAFNRIEGSLEVYAVGDIALMQTDTLPHGHPQLASVAKAQAKHLSVNIKRFLQKQEPLPFIYRDKGTMAIVGRNKAVLNISKPAIQLNGFIAWVIWAILHLFLLMGIENRVQVFFSWAHKYITWDQSLYLTERKKVIVGSVVNAQDKNTPPG